MTRQRLCVAGVAQAAPPAARSLRLLSALTARASSQAGSASGGLFDRWAGFWPSWTNRLTLFKNIEVDYLLRAARQTP